MLSTSEIDFPETPLIDDGATMTTSVRANIDHVIGHLNHVGVMLDHQDGIALVTQLLQQLIQAVDIARVHPDAGFVKDVQDIHQAAAQMLDHLDALRLTAGQRIGFAVEAEVCRIQSGRFLMIEFYTLPGPRSDCATIQTLPSGSSI
jgi:hypothetical protein